MADTSRTKADLKNNIFQDNQAAGSITAQDMRDLIESANFSIPLGWEFVYDLDYPDIANARTITDGARTQITITPNPAEDLRYPATFPGVWNSTLNKVVPPILNGFGILRLSLVAWKVDNVATATFDVEFDVSAGGSGNIIYDQTNVFSKGFGSANHQHFNFVMPLFVGSDFATNGGAFYITPTGSDISIFQITLTGARIYSPAFESISAFGV